MAGTNIPSGGTYKINGVDIETYSNSTYPSLSTKTSALDYLLSGSNSAKPVDYVQQAEYYVATNGVDTDPGTYAQPFATLNKALSVVVAGDTIYMRAGTYDMSINAYSTARGVYINGVSGTSSAYYKISGYPGERVILNFSGISFVGIRYGLHLRSSDYWKIENLEFIGLTQSTNYTAYPFTIQDCNHVYVDNCKFHDNQGPGTRTYGAFNEVEIKNCDAYNNYDPTSPTPGGNADGFGIGWNTNASGLLRLINCRAWNNSDDGYDSWLNYGLVTYDNCWAWHNGYIPGTETAAGDGSGFKFGSLTAVGYESTIKRTLRNCIAFANRQAGFNQNNLNAIIQLYNCTSYGNVTRGYYFWSFPGLAHVIRNNISYANTEADQWQAGYTHDHNTWDIPITVTDADFQSLSPIGLNGSRKLDGSSPDIKFLTLSATSQLLNVGVDVGLPYLGTAPDLGAFEVWPNYSSQILPTDNILDWNETNNWYAPYSSKQASMSFYTGTTNPTLTTRLNLDGILYVSQLNSSSNNSNGVNGTSLAVDGVGVVGTCNSTNGVGVYGTSSTGVGLIGASQSGVGASIQSNTGNVLSIGQTGTSATSSEVFRIFRSNGGTGNITGNIINITDNPTTSGTISGKVLSATIGSAERISLNPRAVSTGSAVAYMFDTHNTLTTGDKLLSIRHNGTERLGLDYNGKFITEHTFANLVQVNLSSNLGIPVKVYNNYANPAIRVITGSGAASSSFDISVAGTNIHTSLYPNIADSSSAIAYTFDTYNNLTTTGAKLASFKNQGVERFRVTPTNTALPAGASTTFATVGGILKDFYTDVSTSGTAETDLYSYTIPANTLANDGDKLEFKFILDVHTIPTSSYIRLYFASMSSASILGTLGTVNQYLVVYGTIIRTSSSTFRYFQSTDTNTTTNGYNVIYVAATGKNFTIDNLFKITGQCATNSITATMGYIEYKPAAIN